MLAERVLLGEEFRSERDKMREEKCSPMIQISDPRPMRRRSLCTCVGRAALPLRIGEHRATTKQHFIRHLYSLRVNIIGISDSVAFVTIKSAAALRLRRKRGAKRSEN